MKCKHCGREITDEKRNECRICSYDKRHNGLIEEIVEQGFWKKDELHIILESLFYYKVEYINDIMKYLPCKKLRDLVLLLRFDLKIGGNTNQKVIRQCCTCGENVVVTLAIFLKDRIYCSMTCRDISRSKNFSGKNSPSFNQSKILCTNCLKLYSVPQHKLKRPNSHGDTHNFCCQQCYWEYRSKYYVGDKSVSNYRVFTEECRKKMSQTTSKLIAEGKIPQTKTKPHLKVVDMINNLGDNAKSEYLCKYHSVDVYVESGLLLIEVMGDYWHGSPLKYESSNLSKIQLKSIKQDKSKHTYVEKYLDTQILYLWEKDIKERIDVCEKLYLLYKNSNKKLKDYNSFNYSIVNGELKLNEEIIFPYFIKQNPVTTTSS